MGKREHPGWSHADDDRPLDGKHHSILWASQSLWLVGQPESSAPQSFLSADSQPRYADPEWRHPVCSLGLVFGRTVQFLLRRCDKVCKTIPWSRDPYSNGKGDISGWNHCRQACHHYL